MEQRLPIKQEYSAGGCVFKKIKNQKSKNNFLWLLGKHSGYHKWVLPKGMIEMGETASQTAVRETQEEVAVTAKIVKEEPIHIEKYWFVATSEHRANRPDKDKPVRRVKTYQEDPNFNKETDKIKIAKTVKFFLMEYVSGDPTNHGWEMEDAGWFSLQEALKLMSFGGEKQALEKAAKIIKQS